MNREICKHGNLLYSESGQWLGCSECGSEAYTHNTSRKVKKGKVFDIEKLKEKINQRIGENMKDKKDAINWGYPKHADRFLHLITEDEWLLEQINKLEEDR